MANDPGVNQGKGKFLREFLASSRDASLEAVNSAWSSEGREGGVSESLFNKIRAELGLTGRKGSGAEAEGETPKRSKSRVATKGKRASRRATPEANGSRARSAVAPTPRRQDEEDILDELEEGIDELIQKIRELGNKPEAVKALRRARRLLILGQDG